MSKIIEVPFGTRNENGKDAVFVAIIAKEAQPYKNYKGKVPDKNVIIPLVLMLNRWDGRTGFPGGNVDANEDLADALVREVDEEISFSLDSSKLIPVCSHSFAINTHLYAYYVDETMLLTIAKNIYSADDFVAEITGFNLVQLATFGRKGLPMFLQNNFATSVKEELEIVLGLLNIKKEE